ncbi:MAG: FmdB family zinc ribbon protein [Solirubrobacteraceae bacterium]
MPLYEYQCKKGHTFELMQPIMAESLDKCTICGAPAERVLYAPAVHFKGSGFYNTDYGTKKRSRELKASAESGADKHDAKSSEKKKESSSSGDSSSSSGEGGASSSASDSASKTAAAKTAKSSDS